MSVHVQTQPSEFPEFLIGSAWTQTWLACLLSPEAFTQFPQKSTATQKSTSTQLTAGLVPPPSLALTQGISWFGFIYISSHLKSSHPSFSKYSLSTYHYSLVAQTVKNPPAMQETWVQSLGQEDSPEEGMATHSSILAWRIPWTEEPDRLQSMGSQRVGHN